MQPKCSTCTPQHITKTYFWVKVYVGVSWTLRFSIRLFSFDRKVERYRLMFLQQTNGSSRTLNPSHLKVLREILCCIFLHARLWFVLSWELIFMIDWNDYFGLRQCWWGFYNRKIDVHWRLQWELSVLACSYSVWDNNTPLKLYTDLLWVYEGESHVRKNATEQDMQRHFVWPYLISFSFHESWHLLCSNTPGKSKQHFLLWKVLISIKDPWKRTVTCLRV